MELAPRLHPNGNLEGDIFVPADSTPPVQLTAAQVRLLGRCDGKTPAYSLGEDAALLEELASQKVLLWECEVPALHALAFEVLVRDIAQWRPGPVRARWEERVQQIASLPEQFAATQESAARTVIMATAQNLLDDLGPRQVGAQRSLYAASNPIAEECARDCSFCYRRSHYRRSGARCGPVVRPLARYLCLCGVTGRGWSAWPVGFGANSKRRRAVAGFSGALRRQPDAAHRAGHGCPRASRVSGSEAGLSRNDQQPRASGGVGAHRGRLRLRAAEISTTRNSTNTPTRLPIYSCRLNHSPQSKRATINGSLANCIRQSRSCITLCIGAARIKPRFRRPWPAQPASVPRFTSGFSRLISRRTPRCVTWMRCLI